MTDRIGQQLGSYRLVRLLGQGGFAEVYLGQHIYLSAQQAAIKVLKGALHPEHIEAFKSEANFIATLKHPHIVQLLDFNVTDGMPFLVMDYASNGSMRHKYPRKTHFSSPQEILPYLVHIADALQYAHDQKLIHRDMKPENILLNQRGEPFWLTSVLPWSPRVRT